MAAFIAPAVALAAAAGALDIAAFARLGGVFASVMTGNLTLLGLAAANASGALAAHVGVALAGYFAGVAFGSRIARGTGHADGKRMVWPPTTTRTLVVEFVLFLGITLGWELTHGMPAAGAQYALLAVAAAAMGLQAAALRGLAVPVATTYLTGTLTAAIAALATGEGRRGQRVSVAVIVAHAAGAAAGGGLVLGAAPVLPALPCGLLAAAIAVIPAANRRRDQS